MRLSVLLALPALVVAPFGCHARVYAEPPPYAVTTVTAAPYAIEAHPHVYYEGRPTYWYGNRWWYHHGGRWHYYVQEPPVLYRQRPYVQQAPPAPRPYAPPAVRVQ